MTSRPVLQHRRQAALHVYAALCVMTGLSGLALSIWTHPHMRALQLADAGSHYEWQSRRADLQEQERLYLQETARALKNQASEVFPVSLPGDLKKDFYGVDVSAPDIVLVDSLTPGT